MLLPPHQKSNWSEEDYINTFLSHFQTKIGNPVVYRDRLNDPIVISEELFLDRKENKYKVFKADREVFLNLLADTIKESSEIFILFVKDNNGTIRICKRYIKLNKIDKIIGGFAVFDLIKNLWRGTTVYFTKINQIKTYRQGLLVYAKY